MASPFCFTRPGQQGKGPGCFQRRGPSDENPGAGSREEQKGQRAEASPPEQAHCEYHPFSQP